MIDYTIRPEEPADRAGIRELLTTAFPTADEANLVDALRENRGVWGPGASYVAVDSAQRVLAHSLLTRCWIDSWPALALAPCAVLPEYQRAGIGTAVTKAALERVHKISQTTNSPLVAVVLGHAEYYPRFGFEPARYFGVKAPFDVPHEAFMVLNLNPEFEIPSGTVHYPSEFGIAEDDD